MKKTMKKTVTILLALCMVAGLCACGGKGAGSAEPTVKPITAEDLAGTWSQSLWFFTTTLQLNGAGTYDYGEEKGTFAVSTPDNSVTLTPRFSNDGNNNYQYYNGYLYCTSRSFTKDMEYGLGFSPDENGKSNQRFNINLSEGSRFDPDVEANSIDLTFKEDGTFTIFTSIFRYSSSLGMYFNDKPFNTYEGTYQYADSILTLTYEGVDHPLVVRDGTIYYITYSK